MESDTYLIFREYRNAFINDRNGSWGKGKRNYVENGTKGYRNKKGKKVIFFFNTDYYYT